MFSPDVNDASTLILDAYNDILSLRNYSSVCRSLQIGKPSKDLDPEWLIEVRNRVKMLSDAMGTYSQKESDIFSGILYPFINYQTLFSAFADQRKVIKGKDEWMQALTVLKNALSKAAKTTGEATDTFSSQYQNIEKIQPLLDQSIQKGWTELASEEQEMVKIATALGGLQQAVQNLSSNLTSSDIRNGKSYVQSTVTIAYGIVMTAELTVPYLSFASILFTVGSSVYDVISNSEKIQNYYKQITSLENQASAEAQAAAATKATIQVLSNLGKSFASIDAHLPRLQQMWQAEEQKIVDAMNAIDGGADPSLYFDIQTMNIAEAGWKSLFDLVEKVKQPIEVGKPVTVDPNKSREHVS